jgi:hypothetical protein
MCISFKFENLKNKFYFIYKFIIKSIVTTIITLNSNFFTFILKIDIRLKTYRF